MSLPAYATRQEPPRQSGDNTSATAGAQATSVAGAAASNRTSVRTSATGGRASSSSAGGAATASGSQSVSVTGGGAVRQAPDVNAPAIWSNNPCLVGLSGGVSVVGFGASIGAGIEDRDCTRRANAQHLAAMGEREAAREVLCGSREVREAFARIGRPCAGDAPRVVSVSVTPTRIEAPAPVNTSGLSDGACATLRQRGMSVAGCP